MPVRGSEEQEEFPAGPPDKYYPHLTQSDPCDATITPAARSLRCPPCTAAGRWATSQFDAERGEALTMGRTLHKLKPSLHFIAMAVYLKRHTFARHAHTCHTEGRMIDRC